MCRFCPNLPKPTQERTNPPLSSAGIRSFSQLTVLQPAESPGMVVSVRYCSYFTKNTHGFFGDFLGFSWTLLDMKNWIFGFYRNRCGQPKAGSGTARSGKLGG